VRSFSRSAVPAFWVKKEAQWQEVLRTDPKRRTPLHDWWHEKCLLSKWFHDLVRADSGPRLCAYCDGRLGVESGETIDHFVPEACSRSLALAWINLFPACHMCNVVQKRDRLPWRVLRPDMDSVDSMFELDPENGELRPSPDLNRRLSHRVRRTIRLFGLNLSERCKARARIWKEANALKIAGDEAALEAARTDGPYRFVVEAYIRRMKGAF
jgi:uncharacterized protein (TIGR02646 family)